MRHPKELLAAGIVADIRNRSAATEALAQLPQETLSLIYKNKWFHLLVPRSCGGKELSLPETVQLFEALAWADANVGWCVNLGAGANMFAGYFSQEVAQSIFASEKTCCAGSGAITGKARKTTGGYTVSGKWKYASGANHATHFTANAYLYDEDNNPVTLDGNPVFRSFIFAAADITNHKNWKAIGLKATSSNDFEANDVFVPDAHTFSLLQPSDFAGGTVYRFPFAQLAVVNMSCMLTGIALHFIDLYEELSVRKKPLHSDTLLAENATALAILTKVKTDFNEARQELYGTLHEVWDLLDKHQQADARLLSLLDNKARIAARQARQVINELYPLCGMSILDPDAALNKVWRDAATASQHYLLSPLNQ